MLRAKMSARPPGGNGEMSLPGFSGYSAEHSVEKPSVAASAANWITFITAFLLA
jgi:hypothetical protein